MNIDHIHDRIPLAAKLTDLLVRNLELQGDDVILGSGLGVHGGKVEPPAGNRVKDAHQRALLVAITDVKDLHVRSPKTIWQLGSLAME